MQHAPNGVQAAAPGLPPGGPRVDGARVLVPMTTLPGADGEVPGERAGLHAVAVDSGAVLWSHCPQREGALTVEQNSPGILASHMLARASRENGVH
jgi:hypothetical protein